MGVRLYDPRLGRFLEVDPLPCGTIGPYDYAAGDPVNVTDLSGLHYDRGSCVQECQDGANWRIQVAINARDACLANPNIDDASCRNQFTSDLISISKWHDSCIANCKKMYPATITVSPGPSPRPSPRPGPSPIVRPTVPPIIIVLGAISKLEMMRNRARRGWK